jgi:hypothetical protein
MSTFKRGPPPHGIFVSQGRIQYGIVQQTALGIHDLHLKFVAFLQCLQGGLHLCHKLITTAIKRFIANQLPVVKDFHDNQKGVLKKGINKVGRICRRDFAGRKQ